jgi:sulfur carrier protein
MQVLLNGDPYSIDQSRSIADLISSLELDGKYAVELNQNIIPRSEYSNTILHPGDNIEIVQAIGGG